MLLNTIQLKTYEQTLHSYTLSPEHTKRYTFKRKTYPRLRITRLLWAFWAKYEKVLLILKTLTHKKAHLASLSVPIPSHQKRRDLWIKQA